SAERAGAPCSVTLILTRSDVETLLDLDSCIAAVENAFRAEALGHTLPAAMLGTRAPLGSFHVKSAGLLGASKYYAAKVNANFPSNPARHGLPAIQGVISLHDADTGTVLALLDSTSITALRTAAATGVAAKCLARSDARVVAIAGCGVQGRSQLRALTRVRPIDRVYAHDVNAAVAERFADEMRVELACDVEPVREFGPKAATSDIVVTCTPSRRAFLSGRDVRAGARVRAQRGDERYRRDVYAVAARIRVGARGASGHVRGGRWRRQRRQAGARAGVARGKHRRGGLRGAVCDDRRAASRARRWTHAPRRCSRDSRRCRRGTARWTHGRIRGHGLRQHRHRVGGRGGRIDGL
ncbi:MAG TPA: hypothetical protein VFS57_11415, partial [Gemmatimonadaceae bacterium]|nr:hypothetical protein [Gemmatimonadaceae bacterium]